MNKIITFDNSTAKIVSFENGAEVKEFHVIIQVTSPRLTFQEQVGTIINTLSLLRAKELENAHAVFKRYFLSDAANQSDELMNYELESPDCALSIIQQAPLNGTKIALWAYLQTNVQSKALSSGLYEIKHGKLGRALLDTTVSGVAFDMLKTVDMVSDTVEWSSSGFCGKKQMIPVGMGGPCMRCMIMIGGR